METTALNTASISFKEYILAGLVFLSTAAVGYFWRGFEFLINMGAIRAELWGELAALIVFCTVIVFFAILHSSRWLYAVTLFLSSLFLFVFYPFDDLYLAGIIASFLLLLWGTWSMQQEEGAQAQLRWFPILRSGYRKIFTGIAIAFSILFFTIGSGDADLTNFVIPKPVFNTMLPVLERPIAKFIPGFDSGATIDEIVYNYAISQFEGQIDASKIPKAEVQRFLAIQRAEISKQLGFPISGKEHTDDVLYRFTAEKLTEYAAPYRQYLPAILSIGYFLALHFFFVVFSWIMYGIFPIIAKLLIMLGFFKRESMVVNKETITL